jgi:hypothetical protein
MKTDPKQIEILKRDYLGPLTGSKRIVDTLLAKFIWEKFSSYVEPKRRGVPKGEKIGLSLVKYLASLIRLTAFSGKAISEAMDLSYGVFRLWLIDDAFNRAVDAHIQDFTGLWIDHLKIRVDLRREREKNFLQKPLRQIAVDPLPSFGYEEYADMKYYSPQLLEKIIRLNDELPLPLKLEHNLIILYAPYSAGNWVIPEEREMILQAMVNLIDYLEKLFLKDSLTKSEKAEGFYILRLQKEAANFLVGRTG